MSVPVTKMAIIWTMLVGWSIGGFGEDENWEASNDIIYEPYKDLPGHSIILWWTDFTHTLGIYKECDTGTCYFTEDRSYLTHPSTRTVLFYGSDFKVEDLPIPRMESHWWGLLHEESPKNNPLFDHQRVLELFNLTGTFRRGSDFPLTLFSLQSLEALTSRKEFVPTKRKNDLITHENLAPIVYVHSDCDTPSARDQYVRQLAKYIKIDSYGDCLHNLDLPGYLKDAASTHNHPDFRAIMAKYKFTLAIENAACDDYITEKYWRPLTLGSIPVYWGSPSVEDWQPNPNSTILINNFDSPRELARHLRQVLENDELYDSHLQHKLNMDITNPKLIEALRHRKWGVDDMDKPSFVDEFECFICDQVSTRHHDLTKTNNQGHIRAGLEHYGCPEPPEVLTGAPDPTSFWAEQWRKAGVEAAILGDLVSINTNYTAGEFYERVIERLQGTGYFTREEL